MIAMKNPTGNIRITHMRMSSACALSRSARTAAYEQTDEANMPSDESAIGKTKRSDDIMTLFTKINPLEATAHATHERKARSRWSVVMKSHVPVTHAHAPRGPVPPADEPLSALSSAVSAVESSPRRSASTAASIAVPRAESGGDSLAERVLFAREHVTVNTSVPFSGKPFSASPSA